MSFDPDVHFSVPITCSASKPPCIIGLKHTDLHCINLMPPSPICPLPRVNASMQLHFPALPYMEFLLHAPCCGLHERHPRPLPCHDHCLCLHACRSTTLSCCGPPRSAGGATGPTRSSSPRRPGASGPRWVAVFKTMHMRGWGCYTGLWEVCGSVCGTGIVVMFSCNLLGTDSVF